LRVNKAFDLAQARVAEAGERRLRVQEELCRDVAKLRARGRMNARDKADLAELEQRLLDVQGELIGLSAARHLKDGGAAAVARLLKSEGRE
jgi:hypothetical protein